MDKKRTIKSLQLDEGEKYCFQYGATIYRVEYSNKKYFLDKRVNGKWETVAENANRMKLVPDIK